MKPVTMMLAAGIALVASSALAEIGPSYEGAAVQPRVIHVETWQLLQSSGAELYGQLCASCHGSVGLDQRPAAETPVAVAPPLTQLRAAGIPEKHWTYVILSPGDDPVHRAHAAGPAMPCWRLIFREALGHEAAPMLVSVKLLEYLQTIQQ